MAAAIMPRTGLMSAELVKLSQRIIKDCRPLRFTPDNDYFWAADELSVHYAPPTEPADIWNLLHEIAHAQLGHHDYDRDIELLRNETSAWELAISQLAPRWRLTIPRQHAEAQLDSYRDWLAARSCCPRCQQTGLQTNAGYECLNCAARWNVNDARRRRLLRTAIKL